MKNRCLIDARKLGKLSYLGLLLVGACAPMETEESDTDEASDSQAVTTVATSCRGDSPYYRMLGAEWPALATAQSVSVGSQGIELSLSNDHADDLYAETTAYIVVDGREAERVVVASQLVPGGGATSVWIHPAALGVSVSNMRFSGRLSVGTVFRDASGQKRGGAVAEALSFHPDAAGGLLVYGEEVRRTQFHAGDYTNRLALGPDVGSVLVPNEIAAVDSQGPQQAQIPPLHGYRFCFNFFVRFSDSGVGEDYYTSYGPMAAHAIQYEITPPNEAPITGYADLDSGCTPDYNFTSTSGFTVKMRAVANLGHAEADDRTDNYFKVIGTVGDTHTPFEWVFTDVDLGPVPKIVSLVTDPGPVANMVGAAVHTAWHIDRLTDPGLLNPPNQYIHLHQHPGDLCKEGCNAGGELYLANAAIVSEKFGVAHEVGHWLHKGWVGSTGSINGQYDEKYNPPEMDVACTFADSDGPGGHAMRSLEPGSAAFTEGTAHFLAAMAWNSTFEENGIFKYYKESILSTSGQYMADDGWLVDLEADDDNPALPNPLGGNTRWRQTRCTTPDNQMLGDPPKYYSTEMDWLRFWWDLATDAPTKHNGAAKPSVRQLFDYLDYQWSQSAWVSMFQVWNAVLPAASDAEDQGLVPPGFAKRFQTSAENNGINQL
ncbi:MAG: hypothetical protein HOW73_14630 [Polyangiaceae bacterium]|nr:hypothetical protein [Polyangiaceae bacterium]